MKIDEMFFRGKSAIEAMWFEEDDDDDDVDIYGWVYGYYVDGFIVGDVIESTDEYISLEKWIPVHRDSVGLASGMYDCTGTMIFDGDLLDYKNGLKDNPLTVRFENGCFYAVEQDGKVWMKLGDLQMKFYQVIDNIWDKNERMEEDAD